MEFIRKHIWKLLLTCVLIAAIAFIFRSFIRDNARRISLQNEEYLDELTLQRAESVNSLIRENLTFIEATAYLYGRSLSSPAADIDIIREYERNTSFDMLRFVDKNGDNYTSSGVRANLSDRAYFQAGMRGESGTTYVLQSRVTGQTQIGFYAPVRYGDEIIGVMVGFYGEDYITRLLHYELFGYEGRGWLIAEDGTVIGASGGRDLDNFYDYIVETSQMRDPLTVSLLKSGLEREGRASFIYGDENSRATGYAIQLEGCGWILIRTFPPSATRTILENANLDGERLILWLVAAFLTYSLLIAADIVTEENRMREAGRDASDVSTGVSRLFSKFVTLDLASQDYAFVGGEEMEGLPRRGKWDELRSYICRIIPEETERAEFGAMLDPAALRERLASADRVSQRVHIPDSGADWFTFNFVVLEREDGAPSRLMLITQDVTELQKREEEAQKKLADALGAAEDASRAKTEFLFNMSHDLRTPMNAIVGYTELAGRDGVTLPEMREFVHKIDSSSRRLLDLINDILEMSRIESGKIALETGPTDLAAVIRGTGELFAAQMESKNIAFTADTSGLADPWAECDSRRLDRILLNLVSNAYKFTPAGGKVSLTLTETERDGEEAAYEFRVRDSGIGMSPEFAEKLFMPFERERTSTVSGIQGTGLGLSITKKLVDLMGGSIDVRTEQGGGTEFVVRLRFPVAEARVEEEESGGGEVRFEGKRLLLAEDNEINREIAVMILSDMGFEVETAENGRAAVEMVQAAQAGYYDAVLMDIQMPVMDGYSAAGAIRSLSDPVKAAVPIAAMTANAFREDVEAAEKAGMNGHIAKPLEVAAMTETLRNLLGKRPGGGK